MLTEQPIPLTLKNQLQTTTIGIWGFGTTGQSVLTFLASYANNFYILEAAPFTEEQLQLITAISTNPERPCSIQIVAPDLINQFLGVCTTVVPSPGIDITPYLEQYSELFVAELDIFAAFATTPYIAITGSVGKTTTTHLLQQFLSLLGFRTQAIGNIGTPMLGAIAKQSDYDYFIIEVSSFQLEHTQLFAPAIATILNLTENHLDRHGTMEQYLRAKGKILAHQTHDDIAILPMNYADNFWPLLHGQKVQWVGQDAYEDLVNFAPLQSLTSKDNLIIIMAIIEQLGGDLEKLPLLARHINRPEHRMELVRTWNGITFYNDSKSTTPASTLYALEQCASSSTILLLGGLSKGIDRKPLIKQLKKFKNLKLVVCFGAEGTQLTAWCKIYNIRAHEAPTLEAAVDLTIAQTIQEGDIVLLSPGGSSYDRFKNFVERGNRFKALIHALKGPQD